MSGPSGSQAEKKAVSIRMDEIGYLEINITVTGKEVVLTTDGDPPKNIKYQKNLKIIIRDPEAGPKASTKAKSKEPNEKSKESKYKSKAPNPDPSKSKN